jgi:hypothetical protein
MNAIKTVISLSARLSSSVLKRGVNLVTRRLQPALEPARVRRSQRGQAIIEMILVLPLIFVFIMLVVDFGLALDRREVIQHGIREAARAGAVGKPINGAGGIVDTAVDQSQGLFEPGNVEVCYVDEDSNGNPGNAGDSVRVSGTFVYEFTVGSGELLSVFGVDAGGWDIAMTPSAESRLETSVAGAPAC